MSFTTLALRASKNKPVAVVSTAAAATTTRAFHSPFAVLGSSPLAAPTTKDMSSQYEKQYYDHPHEPMMSHTGYRTYVVSEPDASARHYRVPAGAYPISSPFNQFNATAAPEVSAGTGSGGAQYKSTRAEFLARGFTTRAAPQYKGPKGGSAL